MLLSTTVFSMLGWSMSTFRNLAWISSTCLSKHRTETDVAGKDSTEPACCKGQRSDFGRAEGGATHIWILMTEPLVHWGNDFACIPRCHQCCPGLLLCNSTVLESISLHVKLSEA